MRTLIDGYNLMHAVGLLGKRLGPDRFRKARQRFLNTLAEALGPIEAHQTTVVFDAATPPAEFPAETSHKGIAVVFAIGEENADARIEQLIARHPSPKTLTVVSSDQRIRQAAERRKARTLTTDAFLDQLETPPRQKPAPRAEPDKERALSARESAYWQEVFADLDDDPATQEALQQEPTLLTDAEIAAIEREVEQEFGR
ncbi:MAG: NYN domain-containing protein [Isosphaeraceae bacterium]|nr:NYN domain-containing protein [Isosphaeraceae bacterium]